ncbi:MAG: carbohydrate ABC transporter permease [Oscillospiraceae bacterium]|jgi:multiple sugar transport system permease protein|nr:carbohydrate ABC transporter permease [Oscillospiraceae bacterium]
MTRTRSERRARGSRRRHNVRIALATLWCGVFAVVFLLPTVLTFANSFMTETEITANYGAVFEKNEKGGKKFIAEQVNLKLIPDKVTFSQYATTLFKSPDYLFKFWNSVILVLPIVVFQVGIAAFAAYSFMRTRGRVKELLLFVYIFVMLMPYQVTLVPNYMVADKLGILGTRWSIILPGVFAPFSVFILTKAMRRIPKSLIEAARLDGCGEWGIFSKICLPMSKGAIFSVAILVFIDYWNMVEQVLIMMPDADAQPLSVFLSQINTGEIGLAFAVATIYMVPAILLFLYGEEYLVEGITYSGGLKG